MFDSLDDTIKHDRAAPKKERIAKAAVIAVLSVLLFGGLYFVIRMVE